MNAKGYAQIKLSPDNDDLSWNVRLQVDDTNICCGQSFTALFPDGEHRLRWKSEARPWAPAVGISLPLVLGVCARSAFGYGFEGGEKS